MRTSSGISICKQLKIQSNTKPEIQKIIERTKRKMKETELTIDAKLRQPEKLYEQDIDQQCIKFFLEKPRKKILERESSFERKGSFRKRENLDCW